MWHFCLFTYPQERKWPRRWKNVTPKITVHYFLFKLRSMYGVCMMLWKVSWLQLWCELDFIWMKVKSKYKIRHNMQKESLENVRVFGALSLTAPLFEVDQATRWCHGHGISIRNAVFSNFFEIWQNASWTIIWFKITS